MNTPAAPFVSPPLVNRAVNGSLPNVALAALVAVIARSAGACSSEGVVGALGRDAGPPVAVPDGGMGVAGGDLAGPVPRTTTSIAAGGSSTCVRTKTDEVRCWGENGTGSLGIGDTEPPTSAEPVAPTPLPKMQAVAAGERAQCSISAAGKVFCWGDLFLGDFNGQPIDHLPSVSPFSIAGEGEVARVAVGRFFTCLLGVAGDVRCFGLNDRGQLGLGDTEKRYLPTTLTGFDAPATSLTASMGGLFACATTQRGSVYCWGDDTDGQIPGAKGPVTSPRMISGLPDRAVEVVAGRAHACARLASGNVTCWGANALGQLGTGETTPMEAPVPTMYLTDVASLAAGRDHTCATRIEGTVFCWGDDADGQTGSTPDHARPSLVLDVTFAARFVSCGLSHSCASGEQGNVQCWGSNAHSQLGPGKAAF